MINFRGRVLQYLCDLDDRTREIQCDLRKALSKVSVLTDSAVKLQEATSNLESRLAALETAPTHDPADAAQIADLTSQLESATTDATTTAGSINDVAARLDAMIPAAAVEPIPEPETPPADGEVTA